MDAQVEQAIQLAFDPRTDQQTKSAAYTFLHQLREDANGWQTCLTLFTRTPAPDEVVRLVCLEVVNNAVQTQRLDQQNLVYVKENLLGYVRQWYTPGSTNLDSPGIQNKLTQTVTYLFTSLYAAEWPSFFDDFRSLAGSGSDIGTSNPAATVIYLRIVGSVHDEIADVMIPRSPDEQKRHNELKDLIRARDVGKIIATWQEILSRWRQIDLSITEMCLRTMAKWVSWIDVSVMLDGSVQGALLELAGQQGNFDADSKEGRARDAAIDTFTETVGKKMSANDKVQLIRYLNLESMVGQLLAAPALSQMRNTPEYDTDLAETLAKLVNNVVFDIVKVLDANDTEQQTRSSAEQLLQAFMPFLLRLFSDEYDEICSAVIPSLTDVLTMLRKNVKAQIAAPSQYSGMLRPILDAIVAKMKYDETATWGDDEDATDEAEFQDLRKRLHILQQTIAAIDEPLYIEVLTNVVANTFSRLDSNDKPNWRDLDLALYEMYLFGELAIKNGGMYQKTVPSSAASQNLTEMLVKMVDADLANYPHPAVQLQYMEICVRYVQFFEHNTDKIAKVLESFVRFVHSDHDKVRLRSWYLFQRYVRHLRSQLAHLAQNVFQAVSDLLTIKAELPEDRDDEDISSDDDGQSANAAFTSQLFLFEAVGTVASTSAVQIDTKVAIAKSVIEPLAADLQRHLSAAKGGDSRAVLQVHHVIMAFGSLAYGFSDWMPGVKAGHPPPDEVSSEFMNASEATITALESLKQSFDVRNAARNAFSRYLGVLGARILNQLPRWIDGLLSSASSNDEMAMFLRTLGQVVYGFKTEISSILDQLLTPLLQQVFAGLAQPTAGTDDEVQLKELKQQYLNFILMILNNDLASVLISPANQGTFDSFLSTLTRFACDHTDPQSARLAFSALGKMTSIWGGPDLTSADATPAPSLPGFDSFVLAQFAPLPWKLVAAPGGNPQDAQLRSVLQEAGALQWTIIRKTQYRDQLQRELEGLGASPEAVRSYMISIAGEVLNFRKFFATFVQQAKR
ncbi:pre-tRNA nuclear export protein [Elasticomyces elasticus]|nr:pre-tRNA nuclear export protein [Elasticomyces elasticus]KAK3643774.1 pre-tRNA nuclear export protein [Elasticomyces elasticus]KAK4912980.1 pre-tRNA nuclear export protein [Elasticomyces elasticus]KAK5752387.1 pre-tRNA nuclear export protein [Elasticomyces elasticus]